MADVVGFETPIFNTPDGGRPPGYPTRPSSPDSNPNAGVLIYTPVSVVIDQAINAINGPSTPGPTKVLVAGGTVGCFTVWVDVAPRLAVGSRYVLILTEAMDAEAENPLPLQEVEFAWPFGHAGNVVTVDGLMSLDELTEIVLDARPSPEPNGS